MMAYQGEIPWHRLGTQMEGRPDVYAALAAANLDWNVDLRPMFYELDGQSVWCKERRAVVRDSDHHLLATVGKEYTPLQNRDAFHVLQPACDQFGLTIETAGALGRGDRVWMLAKMPDVVEVVPGDKVEGHLLVLTGHNGWLAYTARLTTTRVVCMNTLQLAMRDKAFVKLRHTKTATDELKQAEEVITNMVQVLKETGASFKTLAARKMTADEILAYVNEVLSIPAAATDVNPVKDRRRATILELATKTGKGIDFAPSTAWAAFNAVTEYIDHVRPAEVRSPRLIKQMNESAIFGNNARLKQKALVIARRLAA